MNEFNYNSARAREARFGRLFRPAPVKLLLILIIIGSGLGCAYLLFLKHNSLGWLCLALMIAVLMFYIWLANEAIPVPLGKSENINDLLSVNVLRVMSKRPTPQNLVGGLMKTRSGAFLALRFGLTPANLRFFAEGTNVDMEMIFTTARSIWKATEGETISGGMLAVAIVQSHPEHELLLRQMRLELADLYQGINWYNHLHGLIKSSKQRRRDGGIARDFSFGYIPTLQRYGRNLSEQLGATKAQVCLATHHEIVDKIISTFSSGGRQNVTLVGADGSGRSTVVTAFAEKILDADTKVSNKLKYRQVFMLDAAMLISAANRPDQLNNLMIRIFNEAYAAKNIILFLDQAQLFFEDGVGSVDISNILTPVLEAGNLRIILAMNEQKFLELSARNSALANALNKVIVPPANYEETMKVLQDQAPHLEIKHQVICTYLALKEAYRLSEKYIHNLVMPGRALNLLELACNYAEGKFITINSVQQAIEKTQGIKVQSGGSDNERVKLLRLEELIHQRMIDQNEAVTTVADALRRSAAGVRNQNRPIGTFLFLGPTGVGKTELAKAISEVYFNGEDHIIRLDLNEFVTMNDVSRLIADGVENAQSLTAQVMKQPFAVVLLDEIEKAHPQVLTTLLQMLDEGILRDLNNREISFRDTIVIATSNTGANTIREYVARGENLDVMKEQLINTMIHEGQFQPEFLNRFDEICIFKPLSKGDLVKIVDLMIKSINKTLAPQKISVTLTDEAKLLLVERGYDPQMGARPMRRIVQKLVENLIAKLVLSGAAMSGSDIVITKEMLEQG